MLQVLLLSAFFTVQDPQTTARTVEDRLKELDARLTALEAKEKSLRDENATLDRQLSDLKAAREKIARQAGAAWVKQIAKPVGLSEAQSAEFEELWAGWTKEDFEKGSDAGRWKAREGVLRSKLTGDQEPRLARAMRVEREDQARRSVTVLTQGAKLSAEKTKALGEAVVGRLSIKEGLLIAQAHPEEMGNALALTLKALEESVPDPAPDLTDEERAAMLKIIGAWKPRLRSP